MANQPTWRCCGAKELILIGGWGIDAATLRLYHYDHNSEGAIKWGNKDNTPQGTKVHWVKIKYI